MREREQRRGLPFVICAPSGAGKSTLVSRLTAEFPLEFSISCTTRAPRGTERDGVEYYFLSREAFLERRARGCFAEWAEVHGHFYGTPLEPVRENLAAGRDMIFDIDVQGAAQLSLTLPEARLVFILPPSLKVLEERLRGRGTDSEDSIRLRLAGAKREIMESHWFHAVIVNDSLEEAYDELRAFYVASRLHPALRPELARAVCQ